MKASPGRRGLAYWLAILAPILLLAVTVAAVWSNWQSGRGDIGTHGLIALAGAAVFSLGLTAVLVWLMIRSHESGADAETGLPDDPADRARRGDRP